MRFTAYLAAAALAGLGMSATSDDFGPDDAYIRNPDRPLLPHRDYFRAPTGSRTSVKREARKAAKVRARKRARRLGHA